MSKKQRAMAAYAGHGGPATVDHIERNITAAWPSAWSDLTGKQYGLLMSVANKSYHDGRASTGAEMIDSDCVWVNGLGALERQPNGTWLLKAEEEQP